MTLLWGEIEASAAMAKEESVVIVELHSACPSNRYRSEYVVSPN
jgi:hypothetical protein